MALGIPRNWRPYIGSIAIAVFVYFHGAHQDARLDRAARANCEVVSVLLEGRADRDQTVKLFASLREQNPALFDKLVARAEAQDERLVRVQHDLICR